MVIKVLAKKFTVSSEGRCGTRMCYAYNDETFEGIPVGSIWIPIRFAKPENIKIGQIYDMKTHNGYVVKLKPIFIGKEVG